MVSFKIIGLSLQKPHIVYAILEALLNLVVHQGKPSLKLLRLLEMNLLLRLDLLPLDDAMSLGLVSVVVLDDLNAFHLFDLIFEFGYIGFLCFEGDFQVFIHYCELLVSFVNFE